MERTVLFLSSDQKRFNRIKNNLDSSPIIIKHITPGKIPKDKPDTIIFDTTYSFEKVSDTIQETRKKHGFIPTVLFTEKPADRTPEAYIALASGYMQYQDPESVENLVDQLEDLTKNVSELPFPVPEDEEERLREAMELDIEKIRGDPLLVNLAEKAVEYFGVEDCYIGIVQEEEEQFLAYPNSDKEALKRSSTICTYGILESDILEVEDVQKDQRFKYIDQLADMDINSYTGAPIEINNQNIGMFCLVNSEPIEITGKKKRVLKKFSETAVKILELLKEIR